MSEYLMPQDGKEVTAYRWRDLTPEEITAQDSERAELTSENVWSMCSPYLRGVPDAEKIIMGRPFEEAVNWALTAIKHQQSLKDPEMYFQQWNFLPHTRVRVQVPVERTQTSEDYL